MKRLSSEVTITFLLNKTLQYYIILTARLQICKVRRLTDYVGNFYCVGGMILRIFLIIFYFQYVTYPSDCMNQFFFKGIINFFS